MGRFWRISQGPNSEGEEEPLVSWHTAGDGQIGRTEEKAAALLQEILSSGKAHAKLMEIIAAQGGNPRGSTRTMIIGENTAVRLPLGEMSWWPSTMAL